MHTCKCGFKFAGAGEFRNCEAFITESGDSGVVCPECDVNYVYINGRPMEVIKAKDEDKG